ncbi:GNAT family N-acetyltransferase [Raoultibacter phocaeensis]|uniref:GNAT family N-acetyltransferase n=1 Tax=Raoultibacter phocaeensis TaxID=2479841 RepID=UPI0011189574|nr:GNAT family N-acetyltransferase [Raoultibacter phocaeensis]
MAIHIETSRLILRDWKEPDLEAFTEMNSDKHVMRYFPETLTEAQTLAFFEIIQREFVEYGFGLYAVEEKNSKDFLGFVGFHHANFDADFCPCIEIGWRLKREYWRKGYATEGARSCLEHGFKHLAFDRIYSFTAIENTPSQGVMKKIGMQVFEYFDHPAVPDNNPLKPHVCYMVENK